MYNGTRMEHIIVGEGAFGGDVAVRWSRMRSLNLARVGVLGGGIHLRV